MPFNFYYCNFFSLRTSIFAINNTLSIREVGELLKLSSHRKKTPQTDKYFGFHSYQPCNDIKKDNITAASDKTLSNLMHRMNVQKLSLKAALENSEKIN